MPGPRADREDVIQRAMEGLPPRQIADELGMEANQVSCILWYERRKGRDIPHANRGPWPRQTRIVLQGAHTLREGLWVHAEARSLTIEDLTARLIETLIRDDLIDAVLDDGVSNA